MLRQTSYSEADLLSAGARCYIYTLHASNDPECRPRYVGFTCRPKYREREHHRMHKNGRKGEWVASLLAIGERAILTVVFTFRSDDLAERAAAEDTWIAFYQDKFSDLLNDSVGGVGVAKASDKLRSKRREIMKRHCNDPLEKKKRSEMMKQRYADPEFRVKMNEANKRRCASEADRERRSKATKKRWQNPEERQKQSERMKRCLADPKIRQKYQKAMRSPEWREKHRAATKQHYANPTVRQKMSEVAKKQFSDPEARQKAAEFAKRAWENPEYRAKRKATFVQKRMADPMFQ